MAWARVQPGWRSPGMLHAMAVWESPLLRFPVSGWRALTWILADAFPVWSMALSHRNPGR